MQNPYLAILGISYIALIFILGATLLGVPLFGGSAPCQGAACAQLAIAAR